MSSLTYACHFNIIKNRIISIEFDRKKCIEAIDTFMTLNGLVDQMVKKHKADPDNVNVIEALAALREGAILTLSSLQHDIPVEHYNYVMGL